MAKPGQSAFIKTGSRKADMEDILGPMGTGRQEYHDKEAVRAGKLPDGQPTPYEAPREK